MIGFGFDAAIERHGTTVAALPAADAAFLECCRDWLERGPRRIGPWEILAPRPGTAREECWLVRDGDRVATLRRPRRPGSDAAAAPLPTDSPDTGSLHPALARRLDCGVDNGRPYRVVADDATMELETRLHRGALEPRAAATAALQIAGALSALHAAGWTHGDLGVHCVRWTAAGSVILDGDVRRAVDAPHDPSNGVLALGALLYHMLTGQAVAGPRPVLPRDLAPAVPAALENTVLTALGRNGARRYASMREFAEDLGRWLAGVPTELRGPQGLRRAWVRLQRHPVRGGLAIGLGISAVLLLAAALAAAGVDPLLAYRARAAALAAARAVGNEDTALAAVERDLARLADRTPADRELEQGITAVRLRRARVLEDAGRSAQARAVLHDLLLDQPAHPEARTALPPAQGRSLLHFRNPAPESEVLVFGPGDSEGGAFPPFGGGARRALGDGTYLPVPPGRYLVALLHAPDPPRIFDTRVGEAARATLDGAVIAVRSTPLAPCRSIPDALTQATPGMTIEIDDGIYEGAIRITVPNLTLRARPGTRPVLTGGPQGPTLIAIDAPGLVLEGLEFRDARGGGVELLRCDRALVRRCTFVGGNGDGLHIEHSTGILVDDVSGSEFSGRGLALRNCTRATLLSCRWRACALGLDAADCAQLQVIGSTFAQCATGGIAIVGRSPEAFLLENHISGGTIGIRLAEVTGARVIANVLRWQTAISLQASGRELELRDNALWNERRADVLGIEAIGARLEVAHNLLSGGGRGLRIDGVHAAIHHNVFQHIQGEDLVFEGPIAACDDNAFWPDHRIGTILANDLGIDLDAWRGLTAVANGGRVLDRRSVAVDARLSSTESGAPRFESDSPVRRDPNPALRIGPVGERPRPPHAPFDDALRSLLESE